MSRNLKNSRAKARYWAEEEEEEEELLLLLLLLLFHIAINLSVLGAFDKRRHALFV
jgi:hypothetical protein